MYSGCLGPSSAYVTVFFQSLQTMNTEIIDLVTGEEKAEEFLELPCDMPTAKGSINRQLAPEVPLMQVVR